VAHSTDGCFCIAELKETTASSSCSSNWPNAPFVSPRDGKKLVHTNIRNNDFEFFLKLVAPYRHDLTVCAECMFGWYWLASEPDPVRQLALQNDLALIGHYDAQLASLERALLKLTKQTASRDFNLLQTTPGGRLIRWLEDRLWFWPRPGLGTARLSPYRCLAGRPVSELPREIKPEGLVSWTRKRN
jgi:hypothetical protein